MKPKTNKESGWHLHPLMWMVVGITIASVVIFMVAILLPPPGDVYPNVLKGLAILTADMALVIFAYAVVAGKTATFTHGNTTATVGSARNDVPPDEPQAE